MNFGIAVFAAVALAAGPAAAEFGSAQPKKPWGERGPTVTSKPRPSQAYGVPAAPAAPAYTGPTTAKTYGPPATPKAEPFKPYQPYKPNSVFGPDGKKRRD
ncbi:MULTISPECIES: hypothetical protein [unclassified Phenylobacterium]|uniref:hypothetical protein n=1 Tax=unclassified Phenylobacterium TaxID=2640670 RepID=UPI00083B922E|nr:MULTISPECIES: hypothetical protein [unclassified Phenylobacterium]